MFAGTDCLEGNICAAIRVLVMAERHCGGVLTLRRELESEGGGEKKKRKRDSSAGGLERVVTHCITADYFSKQTTSICNKDVVYLKAPGQGT